ncbi:MAG: tetraacyldisaccharide 4'-kinase [Acidobacteriota bacterium]|nr:tetraacyldisaccharide 4'-kinase [Acidobacteriota bacterium]MDH3786531.1 tetraacyldisaccharide 4'-kinase [Acidobacteriota bacterium]
MRPPERGLLAMALRVTEPLYRGAVALRNRRFDGGRGIHRSPLPTISVGNLTAGGTGKTPLVLWLANELQSSGARPAILSRGYGGRVGAGPRLLDRQDPGGASRYGDEPWLMARRLHEIDIVVGSDRVAAAKIAHSQGANLLLLDDGFQHRRLDRDLDIVLLDSASPFDNGHLLPAGLLREPPESLARAGVVIFSRHVASREPTPARERARALSPNAAHFTMSNRRVGWFDVDGVQQASPPRRFGFCGLGNPQPFREDLLTDDAELTGFRVFRDHHRYMNDEFKQILQAAVANDATPVTTEKDLMRMASAPPELLTALRILRIDVTLDAPEQLLERVLQATKTHAN